MTILTSCFSWHVSKREETTIQSDLLTSSSRRVSWDSSCQFPSIFWHIRRSLKNFSAISCSFRTILEIDLNLFLTDFYFSSISIPESSISKKAFKTFCYWSSSKSWLTKPSQPISDPGKSLSSPQAYLTISEPS